MDEDIVITAIYSSVWNLVNMQVNVGLYNINNRHKLCAQLCGYSDWNSLAGIPCHSQIRSLILEVQFNESSE